MPDFRLTTAVAFLIFNRPDTTERVFTAIAEAKPPKLLVVADGPRSGQPGEAEKTAAARAIVERVDWDCQVLTNYSERNLGCKRRVSSGLDWVFEQVEEAIVLEDDCLPDPSFFRFCQEMLVRYRQDARIGMISGANTQFGHRRGDYSYYFSKYSLIWGWASWRDRWTETYDVSMAAWPDIRDEDWLADLLGNRSEVEYWRNMLELTYRGEIDTWDFQWGFANWLFGRASIVPTVNLISNIGYGEFATHTPNDKSHLANIPLCSMSFPMKHPLGVFKNIQADEFTDLVYMLGIDPVRARTMVRKLMRQNVLARTLSRMYERLLVKVRAGIGRLLFR
jgi:hypothetical protein